MDKYVKMLLMKLNQRYKATVMTIMGVNEETGRVGSSHTLRICEKGEKSALCEYQTYSKRELVLEMAKWANRTQ